MNDKPDPWESYRLLVSDIDRYRNLPLGVLTFTSALHFALIAAVAVKGIALECSISIGLTVLLLPLCAFTIVFIAKCHLAYLKLRNVQARLNLLLKLQEVEVSNEAVFPKEWFKERRESLREGIWGWGFFAAYAAVLCVVSLVVIWHL